MGMGLEVVECPGESGPSVDEDFVSAGSVPDGGAAALTPLGAAAVAAKEAEAEAAAVDSVSGSLASLIILEMTSENTSQKLLRGLLDSLSNPSSLLALA